MSKQYNYNNVLFEIATSWSHFYVPRCCMAAKIATKVIYE